MLAAGTDWTELSVAGAFLLGFIIACWVIVKLYEAISRRGR